MWAAMRAGGKAGRRLGAIAGDAPSPRLCLPPAHASLQALTARLAHGRGVARGKLDAQVALADHLARQAQRLGGL